MSNCYSCINKKCKIIYSGYIKGISDRVYCKHHKKDSERDALINNGEKICNGNRKICLNLIDFTTNLNYCKICFDIRIKKNKQSDLKKKEKKLALIQDNKCGKCEKNYEEYDESGVRYKFCFECRYTRSLLEKDQRIRGIKKDYKLSEEQKKIKYEKNKLRRETNPEKTAFLNKMSKERAKIKYEVEYLKKNAERIQKMRDNMTQEQINAYNKKRQINTKITLGYYKNRAKRLGIYWDTTIDQTILQMLQQKCYYCNGITKTKNHNGIDRINNRQGYVVDNIKPCCNICNIMKGCLDLSVFLLRIEHILSFLKIINARTHTNINRLTITGNYQSYKSRQKKKGSEIELSEEQFINLVSQDCYLCGMQSNTLHTNGLDRIDSTKGYVVDNIKPCCCECNLMKNSYTYDEFIDKCKEIYQTHSQTISGLNIQPTIRKPINIYIQSGDKFYLNTQLQINAIHGIWKPNILESDICGFESEYNPKQSNSIINYTISRCSDTQKYIMLSQSHNIIIDIPNLPENMNYNIIGSDIIIRFPESYNTIIIMLYQANLKIHQIRFQTKNESNTFYPDKNVCINFINQTIVTKQPIVTNDITYNISHIQKHQSKPIKYNLSSETKTNIILEKSIEFVSTNKKKYLQYIKPSKFNIPLKT